MLAGLISYMWATVAILASILAAFALAWGMLVRDWFNFDGRNRRRIKGNPVWAWKRRKWLDRNINTISVIRFRK